MTFASAAPAQTAADAAAGGFECDTAGKRDWSARLLSDRPRPFVARVRANVVAQGERVQVRPLLSAISHQPEPPYGSIAIATLRAVKADG